MSAETSRDVSLIQDEDVLRKMWQDTEDFGRKKEIRSHMYKLREARLRDFYNTGEVTSETKQTTTTIKESSTSKGGCELPTHADSLADHSFLSLKTKEIRDSESPTREVAYKISGGPSRLIDQGWNIVSANESSVDGKTHSTTRLATTSGTEPIDGGLSKYAAKTEQKATVYRDGDDKNYVKSVGANSQSLIKQEAAGGDENNRFYTTSTSTSSSSKYTSEQKSTSGDPHSFPEHRLLEDSDIGKFSRTNQTSSRNITQRQTSSEDVDFEFAPKSTTSTTMARKTYTTDVPNELKQHPSYIDDKSKVITETKTLPDGSTMTTTRYETKGGKTTTSSTSSQSYSTSSRHVSNEQKSSSDKSSSKTDTFRSVKDTRVSDNNEDAVLKYVVPDTPDTDSKITISTKNQDITSSKNRDIKQNFSTSTSTTTSSVKVIKNQDVISDSKTVNVNIEQGNFTDDNEIKKIEDAKLIGRDIHKDSTKRIVTDDFPNQNEDTMSTHREQIIIIPSEQLTDRPVNQTTRTVKTTVIKTVGTQQDNQKAVSDDFINVERQRNITEQTKIIPTQTIETVEYVKPSESSTPLPEYEIKVEKEPIKRRPIESEPKFESSERRQPIKPGKSELDDKPVPTEGQYDTTYRTDYVNRRISVEVSPTHDAFARSLRAVSPERESKIGSTRSLRTSSSISLRNSASPEKYIDRRQPSGSSPDTRPCRPVSPSKKSPSGKTCPDKQTSGTVTRASNRYDSNATDVTRKRKDDVMVNTTVIRNVPDRKSPERKPYNTDTLTRRKKITDDSSTKMTTEETVDSNTLTRRTPKLTKPRSRSNSPTSTASEIEFIRNTHIVTDLDVDDATTINTVTNRTSRKQTKDILTTEKRPSTLDITTTKVIKTVTDRSSTSPLSSPRKQTPSPVKEIAKVPRHQSPTKEPDAPSERPPKYCTTSSKDDKPKDKVFKRTDTYEERCRQILGISDKKTITDISVTMKKTERPKSPEKKPSSPATSPTKESPRKPALPNAARRPVSKSPEKLSSPIKIQEFPSQVRKSPEKQPPEKYSEKTKPVRESPKIQEFPSQIRKSPEKQPVEKSQRKPKPVKDAAKIQEFPSQTRESPEKLFDRPDKPEEKSARPNEPSKTKEFPLQIRRSPECVSLDDLPINRNAYCEGPGNRRKETVPSINDFPSQIRRTPEKESLEQYPEKSKPTKAAPNINEFPSQIRKSHEKHLLHEYPEKPKPETVSKISEFPSQIRKTPERELMEQWENMGEKMKQVKTAPTVNEFPTQVRKSPEKQTLEEYPEKSKQTKTAPTINEFPSQIRKSPEKESLEEYPEKSKPTKTAPTINEFPSQVRKYPEEPLEDYLEKTKPTKEALLISEFPSQIGKLPVKQPLENYPEKAKLSKASPSVNEFPSQIVKSPEKIPVDKYPGKGKPCNISPSLEEFPSQVRKPPHKQPLGDYPEKIRNPSKQSPIMNEFPSRIKKTPERDPLEEYPENPKPIKSAHTENEYPAQIREPDFIKDKTKERVDKFIETERLDTNIKTTNILRNEFTDVRTSETVDHKKSADVFLNKGRTDVTTTITTMAKKGSKHKPRIDGQDSESTTENEEEELYNEEDYIVSETIETDIVKRTPPVRESPEKHFMRPIVTETIEIDIVEKTAPVKKFPEKDAKKPAPTPPLPKEQQKGPTKELQRPKATKTTSQIQELPSQVKKSPLKEKPQSPPEKQRPGKDASTVHEFPSQIRKAHQRETLEPYPEKVKPTKDELKIKEFPSQIRKQPGKQAPYPERTRLGKEVPNQIRKTTVTEQKPHEPEEELIRVIHTTGLESRVPIEEVLVTKKFIDVLCQEEEIDRRLTQTDETTHTESATAKRTHPVRNVPPTDVTPHKTVKKDFPGKYAPISKISDRKEASINLIKKERIDTDVSVTKAKKDVAKSSPKTLSPIKKSPDQTSVKRKTTTKTTQDETKFTGVTEYIDEYCKVTKIKDIRIKQAPTDRNVKKITTVTRKLKKDDVDNFSETEEEIRTKPQKTTPTYTTRATKVIQNDEMPKTVVLTITHGKQKPKEMPKTHKTPGKETPKRPTSPTKKLEETRQPKQTDTKTTELDKSIYNTQQTKKNVTKVTEIKQARPLTKTVHKTFEVQSPKRHVVSTIINIKPKTKPESTPVKKAIEKTTVTTTKITKVSPKSTLTTKPSKQTNRARPIQNGHIPTDDETEESDTEEVEQMEETHITKATVKTQRTDTTQTKDKITRTVSDHVIKAPRKTPVRGASKPELVSKPDEPIDKRQKPEKNIITTKSILIENAVADEREIIVDLKRSKSSREETPDRTGPYPVPTNEDSGVPRYPDHITEPEDVRRSAPKRLSDIPLTESENVTEFTRITEVTRDQNQRINKTVKEETDERLLSVNEKINIYLSQTDKKPKDIPKTSQQSERPKYDVDLEDDECLLSVSDKVNKFITTAEQLTVKDIPQRSKSPKLQNVEDEIVSRVSEKVSRFTEKVQEPVKPKDGFAPKVSRPDLSKVDESIRSDECLLSVSDKVTKFISTAEKLTTPDYKKPVSLSKLEPVGKRSPSPRKDIPTECALVETDDETYIRRSISPEKLFVRDSPKQQSPSRKSLEPSPIRQISESPKRETLERRPSNTCARKPSDDIIKPRRDSFEPSDTPKSSRRTSQDEPKTVLSPTGRLRSTETIRKAKALFENMSTEQEIPKQRDILIRPSVFEGRKTRKPENDLAPKTKLKEEIISEVEKRKKDTRRKDVCTKLIYDEEDEIAGTTKTFIRKTKLDDEDGLKSTRLVIEGLKSPTSPERAPEMYRPKQPRSRSSTPEGDIPHYMLPLDRTVRERSPHYENIKQLEEAMTRSTTSEQYEEVDAKTTKFGVTLRRTDSGRVITTRRKSSTGTVEKLTGELDVENIYDLHVLESLLERVVGYDIRRRIRAQIRIIKRLIEEDKLESVVIKMTKKSMSPVKDVSRRSAETSPVKYTSKPQEIQVIHAKKPTPENKFYQHSEIITESGTVEKTSEYRSSYEFSERRTSSEMRTERRSTSPETKTVIRSSSPDYKAVRNSSPDSKRSESPDKEPKRKSRISPEKRSTQTETTRVFHTELKKMKPISKTVLSEKPEWVTQRTLRKVSETSPPIKRTVTTTKTASTTRKENRSSSPPKGTDVITSSYGVGPMDENGSPLFGLKALRAQNKSEKTKVQGTLIRSHYYAENGQEPVGEISVTKYSTDPKDLDTENLVSDEKGITSMTTTQKFGYKGTPALKSIGSKKKQITNVDDEILTSTKTSEKVTRRGSVKEMSQKFIENAVETSKNERQSSYPKAGLILRTSSFRDAASSGTGSSREGSPGMQEICETVTTAMTSKSGSGKADTFLTNKSRVTGVQDVIIRMKNEDVEIGETEEDAEARNLLNKFIGAQVILSGMESHVTRPSSTVRTTTTKVRTTSDGGKPKTVTRTFTQPITEELLETIWDQQTLKLLLEQSTDYEDRRIIRARLRQVMAEQEACAELVEKASEECEKKDSESIQEKVTTHKSFSEGPVTTTQVTTKVTSPQQVTKKPLSPFAKFKQLDKQNSLNSPPSTPKTATGGGPLFKFTDPALSRSASTVKERLLQWCQMKTKEYENIQLDNFSTSWADGLAFCALIHHFLPDAFEYHALNPKNRRHNFTLAFQVADEKADIAPLLDVDDMVATRKPDWKCVFTYVQSIYRRFKDED